nr:cytidylate kinase-like family protein [uncultured Oscillibacter sp.]
MAHKIITIGRQFGSGGHSIGQETADRLGIHCYDKELITLAAMRGQLDRAWLTDFDEKRPNAWLYEAAYNTNCRMPEGDSVSAVLFRLQSDIIRSIAREEDAVIIGRCADHILREAEDVRLLTVFVAAPFDARVQRKMRLERIGRRRAETLVSETDRQRRLYDQTCTGREWGQRDDFDLYFDFQEQDRTEIVNSILDALPRWDDAPPCTRRAERFRVSPAGAVTAP